MIKKILWVSIIFLIIGVVGMIFQKANASKVIQIEEAGSKPIDSGRSSVKAQP